VTQLVNTEIVAANIKGELERGALEWKQAKADFDAEREKLETTRKEMEDRLKWRNWILLVLAVAGLIGVGIAVGLWIAR